MRRTVVELPEFIRRAKAVMPEAERVELISTLGELPGAGVSMGGGLRKLRFARGGAGKSGGYRVVYLYLAQADLPVFLLTVFAKNETANLSAVEAARLAQLAAMIAATYGKQP